ncbi:GNAT family N-acetyltransferase [Erythrobacter sp. GH1-10]|uniref:GNAT family N-acetyltransferase n=1 Tax=Erythrobacter sp. GH1-10 TaxID=3349334 RepID=UPI0038784415
MEAASPFDRADWYELLAEAGLTPLIAIASDADASAALALTEEEGRIVPLRNWYSFTWRQLAPEGEAGDRLLVEIARQLKKRGHRVTLEPVPEEDGSASRLAKAFSKAGWQVDINACDTNHILNVGGRSFSEYWASRPGPLRTTLKRKAKKVAITILTDFDAKAWMHYERIYSESWKPDEDHPDMLRAFAEQEARAARMRLGLALHDGEPIAAQFWTVENGTAFIHKLAHLESHKQLSAGTTLSAALFEHVIDVDGVSLVDFGTGDQPYKADWMEETRPRYRVDCIDPKSPKGWIDLAKRAVRRLRADQDPTLARMPVGG